ncbi:MAG: ABC transporter permease [Anaerolineales bacterium]|nr:ABC transporter permease [Anaerolineales bacterium]
MSTITNEGITHPVLEEMNEELTVKRPWFEEQFGTEAYRNVKLLWKTPASVIGFILLGIFILVAILAPVLAPPLENAKDPYLIPRDGFSAEPKPPMTEWNRNHPSDVPFWYKLFLGKSEYVHILGTTPGQWDIWYGIVWGTRTAFKTGVIITLSISVIGILLGTISAFYGKLVDSIIMRIVDVFMSLPFIMAALIFSSVMAPILGKSILPPMLALITFGWMYYARLIRSNVLSEKEKEYIQAAKAIGERDLAIMIKHIIPNTIYPALVIASMDMGGYVLSFAALSFLGIGADLGYADWGQIISFSRDWISSLDQYWYTVVFPGFFLFLFVLAWNLIGDAVRDVMDPYQKGKKL